MRTRLSASSLTVVPLFTRRWSAFAALCLGAVGPSAFAQNTTGTITGRVTESPSAAPLVSANIRVTGAQVGAQTTADGRYTIRGVTAGMVDLQITRIGYEAKGVESGHRRRHSEGRTSVVAGAVLPRRGRHDRHRRPEQGRDLEHRRPDRRGREDR